LLLKQWTNSSKCCTISKVHFAHAY